MRFNFLPSHCLKVTVGMMLHTLAVNHWHASQSESTISRERNPHEQRPVTLYRFFFADGYLVAFFCRLSVLLLD
jgi:hypothetical protein